MDNLDIGEKSLKTVKPFKGMSFSHYLQNAKPSECKTMTAEEYKQALQFEASVKPRFNHD